MLNIIMWLGFWMLIGLLVNILTITLDYTSGERVGRESLVWCVLLAPIWPLILLIFLTFMTIYVIKVLTSKGCKKFQEIVIKLKERVDE